MTGIDAFLELLAGAGVRYLFGNPGTTELPLNDALARDHRFQYILGVHEVAVMAMAEGYAAAVVVAAFERQSAYPIDGTKVLPCPHQTHNRDFFARSINRETQRVKRDSDRERDKNNNYCIT